MSKTGPGNAATPAGSSIADATFSDRSNSARGSSARHKDDSRFKAGKLRRYGGFITGYAETFAGALDATRAEIVALVDGEDSNEPSVPTEILINGNRGSDNPGGSTNRIRSEEHDREGVDRVFVAVTVEQFEALGEAVGAEVTVR